MVEGIIITVTIIVIIAVVNILRTRQYKKLETEVLNELGFYTWNIISYFDEYVTVKSRQALEKYDDIKFFKENKEMLEKARKSLRRKNDIAKILRQFIENNEYKSRSQYNRITNRIDMLLKNAGAFRIKVSYISSAGNNLGSKEIAISQWSIDRFLKDPSLLMSKGEYNKYIRAQEKEVLEQKQHEYYEHVNNIIDYANTNRDILVIKDSQKQLDDLIGQLFDRTVNTIKKIKNLNSDEWTIIGDCMVHLKGKIENIVSANQKILEYYESNSFFRIKSACEVLMSSQREFNEYINEKVQSISQLFGTRVVRNEIINDDECNYIRPYKKTITPFTAEVSAVVFASAENNPLEYIVKYFYPNKKAYPEQIQKLYKLGEAFIRAHKIKSSQIQKRQAFLPGVYC